MTATETMPVELEPRRRSRSSSRGRISFKSRKNKSPLPVTKYMEPQLITNDAVQYQTEVSQDTEENISQPQSTRRSLSFSRRNRSLSKKRENATLTALQPIQTSNLQSINNNSLQPKLTPHISSQKVSIRSRLRSISPHARARLKHTFSRSKALVVKVEDNDNSDLLSVSSVDSSSSCGSSKMHQVIIAVTSCRSDGYHTHKAPGATSMLPKKAPSALKRFHELAVGVKDAYDAAGATPVKPETKEKLRKNDDFVTTIPELKEGRKILWDFMGNLDFLLALVDEVATDSVTRGALKDDNAFKSIRDVIKKCNKVLENMLVRRERKYTLHFRLVQPLDKKEIKKMKSWNGKVEKAVKAVSNPELGLTNTTSEKGSISDVRSTCSSNSVGSSVSNSSKGSGGIFRSRIRGRSFLPGKLGARSRRATPTPRLRNKFSDTSDTFSSSADDGFSTSSPMTSRNLAEHQQALSDSDHSNINIPVHLSASTQRIRPNTNSHHIVPKDELVDVISNLRTERLMKESDIFNESDFTELMPTWTPKANIPSTVPKLPIEYIHRHKLMKQVVNSLLGRLGTGAAQNDETSPSPFTITSITSRHADKAGNGKTTLAVACIQTIEIRERFSDGIAWIQLGRTPLSEKDIRRLYEDLYDQLLNGPDKQNGKFTEESNGITSVGSSSNKSNVGYNSVNDKLENNSATANNISKQPLQTASCKRFQGGELNGIKEDLGRILSKKKILICLDDVWRVEDAKWFIFDEYNDDKNQEDKQSSEKCNNTNLNNSSLYRVLVTTRSPSLLGQGHSQEIFVRIFSEHEAVKLLLLSAGRRLHGGKKSPVFDQARIIVKGCGNSPLALRLAGGMILTSNKNWTLSSPTWIDLVEQCKSNLKEASQIRSFVNSVGRIVDFSFTIVPRLDIRTSLRRCFVTFAVVFHDNDWMLSGKGIPRGVVLKLFSTIIFSIYQREREDTTMINFCDGNLFSSDALVHMLEHMNLIQRAGHTTEMICHRSENNLSHVESSQSLYNETTPQENEEEKANLSENDEISDSFDSEKYSSFIMHESLKCIAEDMATRISPSFTPEIDEFTSFSAKLEMEHVNGSQNSNGRRWLSNAANYFFRIQSDDSTSGMLEHQFHELIVASLSEVESEDNEDNSENTLADGEVEKYFTVFCPKHMIRAKLLSRASDLLTDKDFISRRVAVLGPVESSRRYVEDLIELRREMHRSQANSELTGSNTNISFSSERDSFAVSPSNVDTSAIEKMSYFNDNDGSGDLDFVTIQRKASILMIDEVYRVVNTGKNPTETLNMAICLSIIGEGLLKCRQSREAMLRLEEAVGIYRSVLGPYHLDVARALNAVAKALVKLGEKRVALQKLGEASQIFDVCNASNHHDAIANSQAMAAILVEVGDWQGAYNKYESIISLKKKVHGLHSLPVAKIINDFAVVLAKQAYMDDALQRYEEARCIYEILLSQKGQNSSLLASLNVTELLHKCAFDLTLIDLNIASIRSKKGDYEGALNYYEIGVEGLRRHLDQSLIRPEVNINTKLVAQKRHLVSAIGRIGSIKMKLRDNIGALEAYLTLLDEVDNSSPTSLKIEKAKAHVKCATIYRQIGNRIGNESAVTQLKEALQLYSQLHGSNHKDTKAIASSLCQWLEQDEL